MVKEAELKERIGYQGEMKPVLEEIIRRYGLGTIVGYDPMSVGYEDFNLALEASGGKYFVKMFATFRSEDECKRYVSIMERVVVAGVAHPSLYKSTEGAMFEVPIGDIKIRGVVMQYVDGKSFYDLRAVPTEEEMRFFVRQAALINTLDTEKRDMYDSWAVVNFLKEFDLNKKYLLDEELATITQLAEKFAKIDVSKLPHCLVHGDIIKTNAMRGNDGKNCVLDLSVSDHYPRVQELAVLFCNMLFDEKNPETFSGYYNLGLAEYQKVVTLTSEELEVLPLFVQAAHAMHVLCPLREKIEHGNDTEENEYWLSLGRVGLKYTSSISFSKILEFRTWGRI